jgi:hypothetical protein
MLLLLPRINTSICIPKSPATVTALGVEGVLPLPGNSPAAVIWACKFGDAASITVTAAHKAAKLINLRFMIISSDIAEITELRGSRLSGNSSYYWH